ncbi:MAG: hypothetical protein ACJ795_22445 [Ktedonobacteraceae bacterium]
MDVESPKSTHLALFRQDTQSVIHVFAHQDTRSAVPVIVVAELASAIPPTPLPFLNISAISPHLAKI